MGKITVQRFAGTFGGYVSLLTGAVTLADGVDARTVLVEAPDQRLHGFGRDLSTQAVQVYLENPSLIDRIVAAISPLSLAVLYFLIGVVLLWAQRVEHLKLSPNKGRVLPIIGLMAIGLILLSCFSSFLLGGYFGDSLGAPVQKDLVAEPIGVPVLVLLAFLAMMDKKRAQEDRADRLDKSLQDVI